jgi:hypothetical protein
MAARPRRAKVTVILSPDELLELRRAAGARGMRLGPFLRDVAQVYLASERPITTTPRRERPSEHWWPGRFQIGR